MALTQASRELRVSTALGQDALVLEGFSGTETVSGLFSFRLDMLAEDPDVDTESLLRTEIGLTITMEDGSEREINGKVSRVAEVGHSDGITHYQAEMVPWLWFLGLNRDSRIFQQMSVLEIVEQVFGDRGESDYEVHCTGSYPKVEYCVQYRESDLSFVHRLLEQEGIFYFFKHEGGKHIMVIADDNAAFDPSPHQPDLTYRADGLTTTEVVTSFQHEHAVHVGKVTLQDYDPLQPTLDVSASISGAEEQEYYEYPGAYAKLFCNDPGDVAGQAERYARLRLELEEGRRHRSQGEGNARGILVGYRFTLEDHYRNSANREYVVTTLSHFASNSGYRAGDGAGTDYTCSFSVIDSDRPFRPERSTPRPVVEGTQTAVVVGPSGEEVWTDSHGRVKCQFHWDREGQNDENSSCWIRVATPWGGKGYGSVSIPRIGNEVIIDFLEGDPDQPVIVGSLYNADQTPPNGLPDAGIQMGMRSRSSKGGGGYNEISMTDTKDTEVITIHAQFDMNTTVEHDETLVVHNCRTETVGVDESITIGKNQSTDVGANRTETVGANEDITIAANRTESVGGSESVTIGASRSETVATLKSVRIGAGRSVAIGKDDSLLLGGSRDTKISKNHTQAVGEDMKTDVGKDYQIDVGKKLVVKAGDEISFQTGKASIVLKKNGDIVIKGKKITVKGSGDIVMKGSKITQN